MAESTLTVAFNELQAEIGGFLGYGKGINFGDVAWDARKQGIIDSLTKKGLRRFYFSAMLPSEPMAHDWSFLHPTANIDVPSGAQSTPLPDDFRAIFDAGEITATSNLGDEFHRFIEEVGAGRLRHMYFEEPSETGRPRYVAVQPIKGTGVTQGQRFQLDVFPQADQDYTIQLEYHILPDFLTGALPYCYGGAVHSGTILAACLAAAERDLDDIGNGNQENHYMMLLAASMSADRDLKPQNMGLNTDRSDDPRDERRRRGFQGQYSYFTGVTYGTP